MDKKEIKDLDYYKHLPYTITIKEINDSTGHYYVGRYDDLYEAKTVGDTIEELAENLKEVFDLTIESRLKEGEEIPEPLDDKFSGKFSVRIPKSLHRKLVKEAEAENTSLNQLVTYKLSL